MAPRPPLATVIAIVLKSKRPMVANSRTQPLKVTLQHVDIVMDLVRNDVIIWGSGVIFNTGLCDASGAVV